jgi:methyltransferase (TIGR00027 family)
MIYGFDRSLKTLFIWEGVTPYLNIESIDITLAWIRTNSASDSAIIFDYQEMSGRLANIRRDILFKIVSRISDEKDVFGFEKGEIEKYLKQRGYKNVKDVNAGQLTSLYCIGPNRHRKVGKIYSIVHAEVSNP